jgi:hypothetical protein
MGLPKAENKVPAGLHFFLNGSVWFFDSFKLLTGSSSLSTEDHFHLLRVIYIPWLLPFFIFKARNGRLSPSSCHLLYFYLLHLFDPLFCHTVLLLRTHVAILGPSEQPREIFSS